jgi:hypothetical protein
LNCKLYVKLAIFLNTDRITHINLVLIDMQEVLKDDKITVSLMGYASLRSLAESVVKSKDSGNFLDEIYNVGSNNAPIRILVSQKLIVVAKDKKLLGIPIDDIDVEFKKGGFFKTSKVILTDKNSPEEKIDFHVGQAVRGTVNGIRADERATIHFQKYLSNFIKFLKEVEEEDYSTFNIITLSKKKDKLVPKEFTAFGPQEKIIFSKDGGKVWLLTDEYLKFSKKDIENVDFKGVPITLKVSGKEIQFSGYSQGRADKAKSAEIAKRLSS